MNDNVFFDTNIIVYSYSNSEPTKQLLAQKLIANTISFFSTQVLQELTNIATRKLNFCYADATNAVIECCNNNNLHINNDSTILKACSIAERYQFSFYDSLIIASAIECNCSILYSEDMKHNQIIFDSLTIINPFV